MMGIGTGIGTGTKDRDRQVSISLVNDRLRFICLNYWTEKPNLNLT